MNPSLRIGIVGYGKMGRMVESVALERGHSISFKTSKPSDNWEDSDAIIEFTRPDAVLDNIDRALKTGVSLVIGTTGWHDSLHAIEDRVKQEEGSLLHASNFSIGVNLFFALNERLSEMISAYPDYKGSIEESHHTEKLDSPSGTAISLAEGVISNHKAYDRWINEKSADPKTLPIISKREPEVPGTHIITWENEIDIIEMKHEAKNRRGFALGAVMAAEWLHGKKGLFTMRDVINSNETI